MHTFVRAFTGFMLSALAAAATAAEDHVVYAVTVGLSGQAGTDAGAPLILDRGEGYVAQQYDAGFALCDGGGLRNATVAIGWAAHLRRTHTGAMHYVVEASRLAHPEQLDTKTCLPAAPQLITARWEGDTTANPGDVVPLNSTEGFEGTLAHLRDKVASP